MTHDGEPERPFIFGPFLFDPQRGLLSHADGPLTLGSRAREILLLLLTRAGETVPKRELLSHVWSGTLVQEGTLRVHIAALRKALRDGENGGPRYVENVTGLGYRFVAHVSRVGADSATAPRTAAQIRIPCRRYSHRRAGASSWQPQPSSRHQRSGG